MADYSSNSDYDNSVDYKPANRSYKSNTSQCGAGCNPCTGCR